MSVGRIGRVAAAIALGPVIELTSWPAPDTVGPRPPDPPPGPAVDPRWRTADVVALARGIAADRAWDRLPLLADALMDAGCDDEPILAHCRQPGLVRDDSWVVNILLGPQGAAEPGRAPDRGGGK